ncbi:MAG: hypothetical protein AAF494_03800 [Pseudomonadota bacterium]
MSTMNPTKFAAFKGAIPLDGDTMFDPKWFVLSFSLGAFGLILNYDLQLGIAAGTLLGLAGLLYLWMWLRFAPGPDEPKSERGAMVERFQLLARNRRKARQKELSAQSRSETP